MMSVPVASVPVLTKSMPPAGVPVGLEFFVSSELTPVPAACVKSPARVIICKCRVGDRDFEYELYVVPFT